MYFLQEENVIFRFGFYPIPLLRKDVAIKDLGSIDFKAASCQRFLVSLAPGVSPFRVLGGQFQEVFPSKFNTCVHGHRLLKKGGRFLLFPKLFVAHSHIGHIHG